MARQVPAIKVAPDPGMLAQLAAGEIGAVIDSAVSARGGAVIALSGGNTPSAMLSELGKLALPWHLVHIFQVDERVAPAGDPSRNAVDLDRDLLTHTDIPAGNVHLMPVEEEDLAAGADEYSQVIAREAAGRFDLVHLGLGDDGHTASWPPGDPVADVTDRDVAVVGPYRDRIRMTITPPLVNRARRVLWLVSGSEKTSALSKLLSGDPSIPATRVRADISLVLADRAAAGETNSG